MNEDNNLGMDFGYTWIPREIELANHTINYYLNQLSKTNIQNQTQLPQNWLETYSTVIQDISAKCELEILRYSNMQSIHGFIKQF